MPLSGPAEPTIRCVPARTDTWCGAPRLSPHCVAKGSNGSFQLRTYLKSIEEHRDAGELHKSEKIGGIVLPANEESMFPLEPGKEPFNEPTALVPA